MYAKFVQKTFIPEQTVINETMFTKVLERTTHLCVAAHCDDVEIMAYHGINSCFKKENAFFTAIILTDGSGSDKSGIYSSLSKEEFIKARKSEQRKAAIIGEYNAVIFLDYTSSNVRINDSKEIQKDIQEILDLANPEIIYTHSPFDFHNTHVATCCQLLKGLKLSQKTSKLKNIYACEVWGALDWLPESRKVVFDVSDKTNLQRALIGVFDSQMARGKSFDEAVMGRRKSNATFQKSHQKDSCEGIIYALDLIEIIKNGSNLEKFITEITEEFTNDTLSRILKIL